MRSLPLVLALALPALPAAAAAQGAGAPAAAPTLPAPAPPTSAAKLIAAAVAVEPGGEIPLARDGESVVDPAATFRVELVAPAPDARLVLVDRADAHVAASASREVAGSTRLTLAPAEPLVPGSRYLLRVDGAVTRELHDAAGAPFAPASLAILVAGMPPAPEPKAPPKPARKKRRR